MLRVIKRNGKGTNSVFVPYQFSIHIEQNLYWLSNVLSPNT
jgi:hypothetical protein